MKSKNVYFHRDLSQLSFYERLLEESEDSKMPSVERLRFLGIHCQALNQFTRVRIAAIKRKSESEEILAQVQEVLKIQLAQQLHIWKTHLLPKLVKEGIHFYWNKKVLQKDHVEEIHRYFKYTVTAFLTPTFLTKDVPSFLSNEIPYLYLSLKSKNTGQTEYAIVNIPVDKLPRFKPLLELNRKHFFIRLDDIVRHNLSNVFPTHEIAEAICVQIYKDAQLLIDNESSGDLVKKIKEESQKRDLNQLVLINYEDSASDEIITSLRENLEIGKDVIMIPGQNHGLGDLADVRLPQLPKYSTSDFPFLRNQGLDRDSSILQAIGREDHLIHTGYQSYDYVLQFFNEAALDHLVSEIQITVYRLADNSVIANALISAAKNGKRVVVFAEIKARFDEENNLFWAEQMTNAGVTVIYSIPNLKVHAKVAQVTRQEDESYTLYSLISTGNYNESKAYSFSDTILMTSEESIGKELSQLFNYLYRRGEAQFNHLLLSRFNLRDELISKIDKEISAVQVGVNAVITIKVNGLSDREIIDKLYEASEAGVKINLIIRGICCLVPRIDGLSENIRVIRIVGNFVEHSRIFWFNNHGEDDIYIGSCDLMPRNLDKRIELLAPIYDHKLKAQIIDILNFQLDDNHKAREVDQFNRNVKIQADSSDPLRDSQIDIYNYLSKISSNKYG